MTLLDVRDGIIDSSTEWSFAAASDRAATCSKFSLVMCLMIMVIAEGLVMRSAVFTSPGILFSEMVFLALLLQP